MELTLLYENYKKSGFNIRDFTNSVNIFTKDFYESCYWLEKIEKYKKKIDWYIFLKTQANKKSSKEIDGIIRYYENEIRKIEEM
jgi:hypothetical protein